MPVDRWRWYVNFFFQIQGNAPLHRRYNVGTRYIVWKRNYAEGKENYMEKEGQTRALRMTSNKLSDISQFHARFLYPGLWIPRCYPIFPFSVSLLTFSFRPPRFTKFHNPPAIDTVRVIAFERVSRKDGHTRNASSATCKLKVDFSAAFLFHFRVLIFYFFFNITKNKISKEMCVIKRTFFACRHNAAALIKFTHVRSNLSPPLFSPWRF